MPLSTTEKPKRYLIEESQKYPGSYNIYDERDNRIKYFCESDGKNKQRAEEWVKNHSTTEPSELEKLLAEMYKLGKEQKEFWHCYRLQAEIEKYIEVRCVRSEQREVQKIMWWLFETGKFTNEELLEFKIKFRITQLV